jgi:hypothetical protein
METGRYLVLHGAGAGFFTRTYIAGDLARAALVEIPVRDLAPLTPATAALIDTLRDQADRLADRKPGRP